MANLYDAYGAPVVATQEATNGDSIANVIRRDTLKEELAGPSVTGVRSPLSGHPAQGITPEGITALLLAAEQGDEQAYLELAEEMEEKDLHYRAVLATRKLQVSGLEITVEAASDDKADVRAADLVRESLDTIRPALFDILDAVGKGFSVSEIFWETEGSRWRPSRIEWRDPRWFGFEATTGRGPYLRGDSGLLEPLAPAKFIAHTCKSKSGLSIRGGLARAAAWAWLFKNFDLKSWVLFAEVYGHPLRVGKYGASATESDKQTLLRAVRNISADHAAIVPDSMLLEFIDAKAQGNAQVFEKLAEYLDRQISKLVLGQTGTTDTGSRVGTADAHERVRSDIEQSDAAQLAATLNRDLVRPLVQLNMPVKAYPQLKIFRPEQEDLERMTAALSALVPLGLKVGMSEVRDRLGYPDPDAGEECLAASVAPSIPSSAPEKDAPRAEKKENASRPAVGGVSAGAHSANPPAALLSPSVVSPADGATAEASPAADSGDGEERDWIDNLADEELDGWRPLAEPLAQPVLDLARRCSSFDEFEAGLAKLAATLDPTALALALGRSMFLARYMTEEGEGDGTP